MYGLCLGYICPLKAHLVFILSSNFLPFLIFSLTSPFCLLLSQVCSLSFAMEFGSPSQLGLLTLLLFSVCPFYHDIPIHVCVTKSPHSSTSSFMHVFLDFTLQFLISICPQQLKSMSMSFSYPIQNECIFELMKLLSFLQ